MAGEVQRVTVEIYGETHTVRGEESPEYIRQLAYEVDKRMKILSQRCPRLAIHQLAILTALNLADELFKLKAEQETLLAMLGEEAE